MKRRAPAPRLVCVRCRETYTKWPGAACRKCGAFSTAIITLDEARARGVPLPFALVGSADKVSRQRFRTGLAALDKMLSREGGAVPGSSVLVAAVPGSGKSTLWLQAAGEIARRRRAVYVTSEQDVASLRTLAEKLGVHERRQLIPLACRSLEEIEQHLRSLRPAFAVVDSASELAKHARMAVAVVVGRLHELAHETGAGIVITSHVNAAGLVRGGPEVAHGTDAVLLILGDPRKSRRRTIISDKNRANDTTLSVEVEMTEHGFVDVTEVGPAIPRRAFGVGCVLGLARSADGIVAVEIEAMVTATMSTSRKITASGVAVERVRVIVETLSRDLAVPGDLVIRVHGPAVVDPSQLDAACAAAIWSAVVQRALPAGVAVAGGLSLSGELRASDVTPEDAAGLRLRLVARAGAALVQALAGAHLRAV
jgi:DNA repair protein RadA/Sms